MAREKSPDKAREARLRRQAERLGFTLHKDRARNWGINNRGGWMVKAQIHEMGGHPDGIAAGRAFELSLDQVAAFLDEQERELQKWNPPGEVPF